jgi:hypothetical protein
MAHNLIWMLLFLLILMKPVNESIMMLNQNSMINYLRLNILSFLNF